MSRQNIWGDIYNKKYEKYEKSDLHVSGGYDGLSYKEYQKLAAFFINKIDIKCDDKVLEVGCGSGAFLNEVLKIKEVKAISGTDFSSNAIKKIKTVIKGNFKVSEAVEIPFSDNLFNIVLSFGVFIYFNSFDYAENTIKEMMRVLRPGGVIYIGEISDIEKKEVAQELRKESNIKREKTHVSKINSDHLYYPISFFEKIAEKYNFNINIIKQDVPELDFCYNASYRFSVFFTDKG